ncbi:MAG: hypothetical protein EG828_13550 [Deltaproteobacteria bacterium]|nr:hypothetical protein [Deltaproteobacteria bacterium]
MEEAEGPLPEPDTTGAHDPKILNYGGVGAKLHVQMESDDQADNVNLAGGANIAYTPMTAFDGSFLQPPSVMLAFEYVKPQEDDAREALDAEKSAFPRLRAALLWNWHPGEKVFGGNAYLKNLAFRFHYRYFKEYYQPAAWELQNYDDYDQYDFVFRYIFPNTGLKRFEIREIYAGFTTGSLIAHVDDDDRFTIGITMQ